MSKKIGGLLTLVGACALSLFLLSCGSSSSRPSGVLYALTQGSNGFGNNVSSFAMDLDSGNLSLVNSNAGTCSTAATALNPSPCGIPLDILLDPTGAWAFVLNQGIPCANGQCGSANPVPPSIYPYTVNSDGSLSAPGTAVTWSGDDTAVAMTRDAAGQFLFVINQGIYTSQAICPMIYSSDSSFVGCPSISVFAMQGATLTLQSGSPFYISKLPTALSVVAFTPSPGSSPCGSTTAEELLYVTGSHDLLPQHTDNTLSVFCVSSSGILTPQANSPYAIAANNPVSVLAVNTNPAGQTTGGVFVYVGNSDQNVGDVNPFQVCTVQGAVCTSVDVANALIVPLATCPLLSCNVPPTPAGQKPIQMLVDPTNNFLYVMSQGTSQLFGFRIGTTAGTLTALSPANEPTGSQPVSMAMHPSVNNSGQFLYTSNNAANNITGFALDPIAGSMSSLPPVITPAAPAGIAVH
jgi:Lactonase, 7-bladed beta-propeller